MGFDALISAAKSQAESQAGEKLKSTQQRQEERQNELLTKFKTGLGDDLSTGRTRGEELFGTGSFGTRAQGQISSDFGDIIARRKANLEGLTPEEMNALQSQVFGGINQQSQTALRQLRGAQAGAGVRGGLAGAQAGSVLSDAQKAQANAARDIFLQNIGLKRDALGGFEGTIDKEQRRAAAERQAQLATQMGYGALGSAQRAAAVNASLGEQQAELGAEALRQNQSGKK